MQPRTWKRLSKDAYQAPSTHLEDEDEDEKDNFWVKTLGRVTT